MKAKELVILTWKLNGKDYRRSIERNTMLECLEKIHKKEQKEITEVIFKMSNDVDEIYIDIDENAIKTAKKLVFKYEENREYEEELKEIDLINEDKIYDLFKDLFL